MARNNKRQKEQKDLRGTAVIPDIEYNELTGAQKVLGPIVGCLKYIGAANAALPAPNSKLIAFWVNGTTSRFVNFGTSSAVIAPTGPTDGIPLRAGDYTILSAGSNDWFIANSGDVFAYEIIDETYLG